MKWRKMRRSTNIDDRTHTLMNDESKTNWVAIMSLGLLGLVYLTVVAVLFTQGFSEQLKTVVVTAVVSGGLGAYYGYWLNSSADVATKTQLENPQPVKKETTKTETTITDDTKGLS